MRTLIATAVGWLLISSGCAVSPAVRMEPELPADLPQNYAAAPELPAEPHDLWWSEFDDDRLDRLIAVALEQNHDVRVAAARMARAEAQARIAGADLKPTVGVSASASRGRQNFIGLPIPGSGGDVLSTTSTSLGVSLDSSWEVDLWGRVRAGARAALADYQAGEADRQATRLSIAAQTAKSWFSIIEAAEQLRLARDSAASFRVVSNQVRNRFERGVRPSLDLRLALSNLSAAEALVAQRLEQLDLATRQLELLLGEYPAGTLDDASDELKLPRIPDAPPVGLPAELVSRRPDLVAAERRLAAADQRVLQSKKALYPRISLTARGGSSSQELGDLLDGDFSVWSLLSNLTQPLFQGGRLRAGVDANEAIREEALARYGQAALRAFAEVETALSTERHLGNQERALAETASQLIAARELAEQRYRSGLANYIVVLESQTRALNAESTWLTVRRRLLTNRVDLHMALGGGFDLDSASTVADSTTDEKGSS